MKRLISISACIFIFSLFLLQGFSFSPATVQAIPLEGNARFRELTILLSKEDLLLFACLEKSITTEMKESLHSGIPLEFTFFTEFLRTTKNSAEMLQTGSFTHTIRYNTLTEEYLVEFTENSSRNNTFSSLAAAVKAVETINEAVVTSANQLLPNNSYRVRIKADLFHKSLPPGLEFLPFLTWSNRKTEWQSIDFNY